MVSEDECATVMFLYFFLLTLLRFGNDIAVLDPRGISAEDIFGFGDSFINANGRDGTGFFVPRRHRGAGGDIAPLFYHESDSP